MQILTRLKQPGKFSCITQGYLVSHIFGVICHVIFHLWTFAQVLRDLVPNAKNVVLAWVADEKGLSNLHVIGIYYGSDQYSDISQGNHFIIETIRRTVDANIKRYEKNWHTYDRNFSRTKNFNVILACQTVAYYYTYLTVRCLH